MKRLLLTLHVSTVNQNIKYVDLTSKDIFFALIIRVILAEVAIFDPPCLNIVNQNIKYLSKVRNIMLEHWIFTELWVHKISKYRKPIMAINQIIMSYDWSIFFIILHYPFMWFWLKFWLSMSQHSEPEYQISLKNHRYQKNQC